MFRRSLTALSSEFFSARNCAVDPDLSRVLANNKEWVRQTNEMDPEFFKSIATGQAPKYLYIGCSDSRVDPGKLMGMNIGDLFVHRNVGNLCPNDLNFLSVLEFAVGVLKVPHIIVCGHYDCGAVRNSAANQMSGLLDNWIRNIRDVHRLHETEVREVRETQGEEAALRLLVEKNVIEQCLNIFKTAVVQSKRLETSKMPAEDREYEFVTPRIHACVFDPADGILKKLDVNIKNEVSGLRHIYDLM
eukprot:TRINITY_DN310_c0_g1_i5.p1 TRINITY_DN310_c0_g1~~TRINITY_DN310_c0_g1_i5.p1  ORF type:complete len:246 (+),score=78.98 TRINITY_DN310_c0_g1_i5:55-792(+)